jgi:hypothetical protein
MIKFCKICSKEFEGSYKQLCCGKDCSALNVDRIKKKHYNDKVKPNLKGRVLKTEEHFKSYQKQYNNSPERKEYMREYRKPEERRIKERESGIRWNKRNPHIEKNAHLKRKYNITLEDYNKMLDEQNGVCSICKDSETKIFKKTGKVTDLAVDHCHSTGKVRGLLCWNCNTSIGKMKDSVELLQNAIEYLKKHRE